MREMINLQNALESQNALPLGKETANITQTKALVENPKVILHSDE